MTEPAKKANPLTMLAGLAGGIGGWSLSRYCGATMWIPAVALGLFFMLFTKTPVRPRYFVGALAATAAHTSWLIVGSVSTGAWATTLFDIVLLALGIVWLWLRPGLASVLFLGLVQALSLAIHIYSISSVAVGSTTHKALTVHSALRLVAIVGLLVGYVRLRRELSASDSDPDTGGPSGTA